MCDVEEESEWPRLSWKQPLYPISDEMRISRIGKGGSFKASQMPLRFVQTLGKVRKIRALGTMNDIESTTSLRVTDYNIQ